LSDAKQALFWVWYSIIYAVAVPIGGILANKIGRKEAVLLFNVITVLAMVYFFIFPLQTFGGLMVYSIFFNLGSTMFWCTYVSFAYDVAEIDDYKTGKRREGSICSIVSFSQKLGSAIGMYSAGAILSAVGYDATLTAQTESTLFGINAICTLGPAAGCLLAFIIMFKYPVNRKKFDALIAALEAKKNGQTPDESLIQDLIK
jgi:GPH family glycoside/pentoside/hexuronide:cation symporter